jgi:glycosyltransferase involved in cell wall biosynthesis
MRLLFAVHQFFPEHYTGTERLALDLSKQMQRMGHSVTVLTYETSPAQGFESHGNMPKYLYFDIFQPEMQPTIDEIVAAENPDIIHVFHPMRVGTVCRVAKARRVPIVLTLTDFWLMCPKGIAVTQLGEVCLSSEGGARCARECFGDLPSGRIHRRVSETKELFKTVGRAVSATTSLKQIFELNGFTSDIRRIPFGEDYTNVVRNSRVYSQKSAITVGFLSTLLPHKGAHVLLEAYGIAQRGGIALRIYGDYFGQADYYGKLRRLAGQKTKIEFCGEYRYEDMPRIYNEIDVLVVPSTWWENSPLVLSRALAHNVPAIVSDLGGMTESIRDGYNGYVFEVSNPDSLAQVLRRIGDDPTVLNQMKENIPRPPRMEEQAFDYDKLYRALLPGN